MNAREQRFSRIRQAVLAAGGYPATSHWIETPHGLQHYVDEGPRDADPILFVHGNPTWSFLWRRALARFAPVHRVLAIDHLGCGMSDQPQDFDYHLASHRDNLTRFVAALDLRRVTLVVHDWGGAIGLGAAVREPGRFARVVAMNTAAFPATFAGARVPLRIRACRIPLLGPLMVRGLNAFALAALATAMQHPGRLRFEERKAMLAPYADWKGRIAIQRFVEDIPLESGHPSWAALREVEQGLQRLAHLPWLLAWGERDWCFTPQFRRQFEQRLPNVCSVPLEDAGHWVIEDEPGSVLGAMEEFLAGRRADVLSPRAIHA